MQIILMGIGILQKCRGIIDENKETIEKSIDGGEAYRIVEEGRNVGGVIIKVEGNKGDLDNLFVTPKGHSKGIGYAAWCEVEKLHPEVRVWETVTPYFEKEEYPFLREQMRIPYSGVL